MTNITLTVYVACLAAYNNGILHGRWIHAAQGVEHMREEVAAMLAESPETGAEEWAIHHNEGFEGFPIGEGEGFEQVCEKAEFIKAYGKLGVKIAEYYSYDLSDAREALEDRYCGQWGSVAEYAEYLTQETGDFDKIPSNLAHYINFKALGRDMELGGDINYHRGRQKRRTHFLELLKVG